MDLNFVLEAAQICAWRRAISAGLSHSPKILRLVLAQIVAYQTKPMDLNPDVAIVEISSNCNNLNVLDFE
jgi:uncharacterized membrane protein YkvA (DUF1232 family)